MSWYVRSAAVRDTHSAEAVHRDGCVVAACGARLRPLLVRGRKALPGRPPNPEQVCPRRLAVGGSAAQGVEVASVTRPRYNSWADCDRTPIPHSCRIQQVAITKSFGALACRLHHQGQVIGRDTTRLVLFDGDDAVVSIRPHLVRVLTDGPS